MGKYFTEILIFIIMVIDQVCLSFVLVIGQKQELVPG